MGYRKKSYASAAEARADYLVAMIDDPAAQAEARRLQPLVRRWSLRRQLDALKVTT